MRLESYVGTKSYRNLKATLSKEFGLYLKNNRKAVSLAGGQTDDSSLD